MPLSFHIQVNDEAPVKAGDEHIAVMTAMVSHVATRNELGLSVGGLVAPESSAREHVTWIEQELKPGDRVLITVVDDGAFDPPIRRMAEDPDVKEQQERLYYERLKERFERR